jgi:thiol-disulfide isomerase/thioredoxin
MRKAIDRLALGLVVSVVLPGCQVGAPATSSLVTEEVQPDEPSVLLGPMSRSEVEAAMPDWVSSTVEAQPDMGSALGLAELATNAEVTVFFGSWCSDSKRELSRLWAALDLVGGEVGFPIRYVAVDRSKREPSEAVGGREILYVPTFVVERDGLEIGQIIEQSPNGVETDLLMLLSGEASGWISARDDLPIPESLEDS